ncbi:MAG: MarR family transcriptional regulator, partial [Chloroflexia bacterium]
MRVSAQAGIQQRIILTLDQATACTVAELATKLKTHRPSVSRSLRALADKQLVNRNGRKWQLTDAGHEEAKRLEAALTEKMSRITENVT